MTTVFEANGVDNSECYSDDFSQDDFEENESSSAHRVAQGKAALGIEDPPAFNGFTATVEKTPDTAYSSELSSSSESPVSSRSPRKPSVPDKFSPAPVQLAAAAEGLSPASSPSSQASSSFSSPHHSSIGGSAHYTDDAADTAHMYVPGSASRRNDRSHRSADQVCDNLRRRADGSVSEPSSRGGLISVDHGDVHDSPAREPSSRSYSQRDCVSTNVSMTGRGRAQRPKCPETAEELHAMEEENTRMREALFQRSRDLYKHNISQNAKFNASLKGNRTAGGPCASHKGMMMSTTGGSSGRQRDAAARLVQESLMLHRKLQILRLKQRDLLHRRDELREMVTRYRRAMRYKDLIEAAKKDVATLTQDHRDAHLEVRCNEKLLLLNDKMCQGGLSDRMLQEEIRSQNALTQRRREHALRDADHAQRMRDAAKRRVEELKSELEKRREWAAEDNQGEVKELRLSNEAKTDRVDKLRAELRNLRGLYASASDDSGLNARKRRSPNRTHPTRPTSTQREDAERQYLEMRIAEMRNELNAIADKADKMDAPRKTSRDAAESPHPNEVTAKPSPHSKTSAVAHPPQGQDEFSGAAVAEQEPTHSFALHEVQETALPERTVDRMDSAPWMNENANDEPAGDGSGRSQHPSSDLGTAESEHLGKGASPAVHLKEESQEVPFFATEAPSAVQDEPPAWLSADDDQDVEEVASVESQHMRSSSKSDLAGDSELMIEEGKQDAHFEQVLANSTAPPHKEAELAHALFSDTACDTAEQAAASSAGGLDDNDGPEWLNF